MTIRQVLGKAVRGVFSKPEVACTLRIAGSKPATFTAKNGSKAFRLRLSVLAPLTPPSLSISLSLSLSLCVTVAL